MSVECGRVESGLALHRSRSCCHGSQCWSVVFPPGFVRSSFLLLVFAFPWLCLQSITAVRIGHSVRDAEQSAAASSTDVTQQKHHQIALTRSPVSYSLLWIDRPHSGWVGWERSVLARKDVLYLQNVRKYAATVPYYYLYSTFLFSL